ncbi:hypothetical protein CR162_00910 [Pseudoroseomonas rhizosphaerae]|uniref:Lipoprotein n=1 Tax=Teichococcus rhizosphaerae TaxID=1335062 RepID=A0A2C7AHJ3_9PROT|nr:hypothetical protein CR162_00910 [Pseudoroseomonas rhizosphaerae]
MPRLRCVLLLLLLGGCATSGELEMTEEPSRDDVMLGGEPAPWRYRAYRGNDDAQLLPYFRYSRPF